MEKYTDNVIMFPDRGRQKIVTKEKATFDVTMVKVNHVNEALETIIPMLFNNITIAGFDIVPENEDNDENLKDNALIVEAIRSILFKYYEMDHPLQRVADEFFQYKSEGVLAVTKRLDVDLSQFDKE